MTLQQFLRAAGEYSAMGGSVHNQLDEMLMNETEDLNVNAVKEIRKLLLLLQKYDVDVDFEIAQCDALIEEKDQE